VPALGRHESLGNAIIPELTRKNRLSKRAGGVKTTLTGQERKYLASLTA
jgi:hypothetical protein